MDGMLSQEEINALLNGLNDTPSDEGTSQEQPKSRNSKVNEILTLEEIDATGEVANISMGSAATTLFQLVNKVVTITTPAITISNWKEFTEQYDKPCVLVQIVYKEGISGSNVIVFQEDDVKIITDLMMGGDGMNPPDELSSIHMSAISEAMNQMMGSAATAMSQMLSKRIDISPPEANLVDIKDDVIELTTLDQFLTSDFVVVTFDLVIGDLIHSKLMQLYPIDFAKDIFKLFSGVKDTETEVTNNASNKRLETQNTSSQSTQPMQQPMQQQMQQPMQQQMQSQMNYQMQPQMNYQVPPGNGFFMQDMSNMGGMHNTYRDINAQPAQFQTFSMVDIMQQKENIDLIMDVPLEVTVELGKTSKSIKEILEFSPGTIIELDKLAGEPIDVLVNGKPIAKGEVVVIDENFGIRITEILRLK